MAFLDICDIKLKGVVTCAPKNVIENKEYDVVPLEDRDKFIESIGIERHRHVDESICTSDLCYEAAEHLIKKLGWCKDDIELLVFVSQTPDYKMPATSCLLQHRLGLSTSCMTIDISQGCSGYVYGLGVVGQLVSSGSIKKALLLVGNTQSKNTNYRDKSTYPLFSDMGSATALEYCNQNGDNFKLSFCTDGSGEETIIIPDGGYRNGITKDSFLETEYEGGIVRNRLNISMKGDDVFAFVISNIPRATKDLFAHFDIDKSQIDYFLMHHASKFIINKLIKKLQIPEEKTPIVLKDFGNSSNASIPLLLSRISNSIIQREVSLFVTGFGVGLSLGVGVLSITDLECADFIEYN